MNWVFCPRLTARINTKKPPRRLDVRGDYIKVLKGVFMITEIQGVHYDVTEQDKQFIEKKMHRIHFAAEDLVSLHFMIVKEKKNFKIEVTIHFHWGNQIFIHVNDFDLHPGIDKLFKKMEIQIGKEKERVKRH